MIFHSFDHFWPICSFFSCKVQTFVLMFRSNGECALWRDSITSPITNSRTARHRPVNEANEGSGGCVRRFGHPRASANNQVEKLRGGRRLP